MNGNTDKHSWKILFGIFLVMLSGLLYGAHYLVFGDAHHIAIYLLGDIAFVPISVLFVTLILEHILERKQKEALMHKLNMVLGAFFSEVGMPLLRLLGHLLDDNPGLGEKLRLKTEWTSKDFCGAADFLARFPYSIRAQKIDLPQLRQFFSEKRPFLLGLLENPNLLEHEKITDMLWAVFHLTEELLARTDLARLNDPDTEHLSGDVKRAYTQIVCEWLDYMRHLKHDYPYLYSLAVRTNPFDPSSKPEIN